jgi:hypothetical protein
MGEIAEAEIVNQSQTGSTTLKRFAGTQDVK